MTYIDTNGRGCIGYPHTQTIADQLEPLVDRHSLAEILNALGLVCSEKADHVRVNWQDELTADAWDNAAGQMIGAAHHKHIKDVS